MSKNLSTRMIFTRSMRAESPVLRKPWPGFIGRTCLALAVLLVGAFLVLLLPLSSPTGPNIVFAEENEGEDPDNPSFESVDITSESLTFHEGYEGLIYKGIGYNIYDDSGYDFYFKKDSTVSSGSRLVGVRIADYGSFLGAEGEEEVSCILEVATNCNADYGDTGALFLGHSPMAGGNPLDGGDLDGANLVATDIENT